VDGEQINKPCSKCLYRSSYSVCENGREWGCGYILTTGEKHVISGGKCLSYEPFTKSRRKARKPMTVKKKRRRKESIPERMLPLDEYRIYLQHMA
jgi:hypothetical protein